MFENVSLHHNGVVPKDKAIEAYLSLGGHIKIITRLWEELAEDDVEVDYEASTMDLDNAMSKFWLLCWGHEEEHAYSDSYDEVNEKVEHSDDMGLEMDDSSTGVRVEL